MGWEMKFIPPLQDPQGSILTENQTICPTIEFHTHCIDCMKEVYIAGISVIYRSRMARRFPVIRFETNITGAAPIFLKHRELQCGS